VRAAKGECSACQSRNIVTFMPESQRARVRSTCKYSARRQMGMQKPIAACADRVSSCFGIGRAVRSGLKLCTRFKWCCAGIIATLPNRMRIRATDFLFQSGEKTPSLRALRRANLVRLSNLTRALRSAQSLHEVRGKHGNDREFYEPRNRITCDVRLTELDECGICQDEW